MNLNSLKPAKGATHHDKRIGRGQGSGHGGYSTRGAKGAQSRSGYSRKIGFEGGQMPLQRRLPQPFGSGVCCCKAQHRGHYSRGSRRGRSRFEKRPR